MNYFKKVQLWKTYVNECKNTHFRKYILVRTETAV